MASRGPGRFWESFARLGQRFPGTFGFLLASPSGLPDLRDVLQEGSHTIILGSLWEVTGTSSSHYQNTIPPMTGQHHPGHENCHARNEGLNLLRLAASVHLHYMRSPGHWNTLDLDGEFTSVKLPSKRDA